MQRDRRLRDLEAVVGRGALANIPDAEVEDYCNACLGPNAYRRRIDAARARMLPRGGDRRTAEGPPPGETIEDQRARHAGWAAEAEERAARFVCRACGTGAGIDATVLRVRREAGL
jgi:hypothetical protein